MPVSQNVVVRSDKTGGWQDDSQIRKKLEGYTTRDVPLIFVPQGPSGYVA